jgi:hypothetical protein
MPTTYPLPIAHRSPEGHVETPHVPSARRSAGRAARAHQLIARMLLGGIALQIFFAGLGIFQVTSFLPHAILGPLVVLSSFALPFIAWRGRLGTELVRRSWLLATLMILQGLLIDAGRIVPLISALHPVNAMLLVLITYGMARGSAPTSDAVTPTGTSAK